jgi:hypothetical protein
MKIQTTIASAMALIAAACASSSEEKTAQAAQAAQVQAPVAKLDAKTQGYVDRMLVYSYRIRAGDYAVASEAVTMMEAATLAEPGNAHLWAQLGDAYGLQALTYTLPGQNTVNAFNMLGKALAAQEKALGLDPDNIVALGGHGSNSMIFSLIRQKPELGQQGIAQMNRAVDLAPKNRSQVQRLIRVQTMINMPAPLRNRAVEMEDLDYLIRIAEGTRQGDFVRVLKGDVAIEAGKADVAKAEYAAAARSPRAGGEIAKARLAALDTVGVKPADIAKLRKDVGQCTTCHGG